MSLASPRLGRRRWLVCGLLFAATTINYLDRQILAQLKPVLDVELGWSNEDFGRVQSMFWLAYAASVLAFGAIIDRVGTKLGYALSIAAWSLAALGHALVDGVAGLARARIALGLGEGGNFPAAVKTVALWFPQRERALATSLFNAGTNFGALLAPPLTAALVAFGGWRAAFVVVGVAGFVWLAVWLVVYDVPARSRLQARERAHIEDGTSQPEAVIPWRQVLGQRQAWAFVVAKLLTDPVWWFFLIWLPDFFKSTRGLDLKASAGPLVAIYTIVSVLSVAGGWLSGRLARGRLGVTWGRKLAMLLFAVAVLPILAVRGAGNLGAVLLIGLGMAAHQAWSATLYTTVSDLFAKGAVARVIGLGGMAGSLGGIVFPIYAGRLLDRFSAAGNPAGGYAALFGLCSGAYLVALVLHHLLAPRLTPLTADGRSGTLEA